MRNQKFYPALAVMVAVAWVVQADDGTGRHIEASIWKSSTGSPSRRTISLPTRRTESDTTSWAASSR